MRNVVDRTLTTKVVTYFNDLDDDQRTIPDGQFYTVRMFWNSHGISNELPEFEDGDTSQPYSRGEMTFLWVGPTGDSPQTAVPGNFLAISMEEAPAVDIWKIANSTELYPLLIDEIAAKAQANDGGNDGEYDSDRLNFLGVSGQLDELWIDNPMANSETMTDRLIRVRPLFTMEQFVFMFPVINKDLLDNSPVTSGYKFGQFQSMKPLVFDQDMDIQVAFNERTLSATEGEFALTLHWLENGASSATKLLTYTVNLGNQSGRIDYNVNDTGNVDLGRYGRSGKFFWGIKNISVTESNFFLEDFTVTLLVKARFQTSDLFNPWPAPAIQTLFSDTFTASDNTLLTNYSATGGWTSYASMGSGNGNADEFTIINNRLRRVNWDATEGYTNGGEALALPTGMPNLADYSDWTVSFDFMFDAGATNSQILLQDYDAARGYEVQRLYIFWNGGATVDVQVGSGTTMTYPITAGTTYQAKLVVSGVTAQAFINDTFVASGPVNDNGDMPAGVLGIDLFDAGADSKVSIDNYTLTTP